MIDIFVVAYHAKTDLAETLSSIALSTSPGFKLSVFDNSEKNYPLSWLWNRFVEASSRPFIALVNPDVALSPGWDSEAIHAMNAPQCGAAGPLSNTTPHLEAFGRKSVEEAAKDPKPTCLEDVRSLFRPAENRFEWTSDHRMVAGHCFIIRRQAWASIGGFNEGIPFAGNDYDFNSRLVRAGMTLAVCLQAVCFHKWNKSIQEGIRLGTFDQKSWCPKFSSPPKGSKFSSI